MRPVLIVLVAAALAGCGSGEGSSGPDDGALISFSRSGGIAFSAQELEVQADGSATVTNVEEGEPKAVSFQLSNDEFEALRESVEAVDPDEVDVETEGLCADCYTYTFGFADGSEIEFDQSIETPPELEELLAAVTRLVEANSPPNQTGA
jgi:hypothetical protein